MKKATVGILILCILATVLSSLCISISAATPTWDVSDEYKESHYYDNLLSVQLTGDMRTDIVTIAMSQLGYHEGDSDADMGGYNTYGNRDFVEYNRLYGKLDNNQGNGYSYGYYWCASFVNWTLRQAQIPKTLAGGEVSCARWINQFFSPNGLYVPATRRNFTPQTGDLIFFKNSGSTSISTHIGIVLCVENDIVYTIEGNTSNASVFSRNGNYVCLKSYPTDSTYIVGYGTPEYTENENVHKVDYTGFKKTCGMYISNSDIKVYTEPDINSEAVTTIGQFHLFTVQQIQGYWYKVTVNTDDGVVEGWAQIASKAHQMTSDGQEVYSIIYKCNDNAVKNIPDSQSANKGETIKIAAMTPRKLKSAFLGWSTDENATEPQYKIGDNITVNEDIILYPVFGQKSYTVTFKMPDGTVISEVTGKYGDTLVPPQVEVEPGYRFVGWNHEISQTITSGAVYEAVIEEDPDYVSETESEIVTEAESKTVTETSETVTENASETETKTETEEQTAKETNNYSDFGDIFMTFGCNSSVSGTMAAAVALLSAGIVISRKKK